MSSQPPTQQSQEVEEDTLVADTRAFWKERGRALVGDSPKAIDDAAKQVITIAGIVIGFYVNAVTKPEFQASLHDWWLKLFFVAPILVLLFSIISGLLVFFPGILDLNINSSTAAKLIYTQMVQRKWQRLLFASVWLVIGIIVLAGALLAYFLG